MNKSSDYVFLLIILLFLIIFYGSMVKEPKLFSSTENRYLSTFKKPKLNDFIEGVFQKNLEDALADQVIGSQTIKLKYNQYKGLFNYKGVNQIQKYKTDLCDSYLSAGDTFYTFKCEKYLVTKPILIKDFIRDSSEFIENYNSVFEQYKTYYYFVTTPRTIDFTVKNSFLHYTNSIKEKLNYFDQLKISNYETYKKYFYKTDHHWNYEGAQKGYEDIIGLMFGDSEKKLSPSKKTTIPVKFTGSLGRKIPYFEFEEMFTFYEYELDYFKTYINRKAATYGEESNYIKGIFDESDYVNHYGRFYGYDHGEVLFDYNNQNKENLLIISSSYSNSINKLIASHFNKTYVIDLRHYKNGMKKEFEPSSYIKENRIDRVLVIMDSSLMTDPSFLIKGGK